MSRVPGTVDLVGTDEDRRPLRKILDGPDEVGTLVLAATTNGGPGGEPLDVHAHRLRDLLISGNGLWGRRLDDVRVLEIAEPTARATVPPVRRLLAELAPARCRISSGSGPYAVAAGALLAAIDAGLPATLLPVDAPASAYSLPDLIEQPDTLRDWLLRHRFWDELADVAPDHAEIWRLLAARQRADVEPARTTRTAGVLREGQLRKLREPWPAVEAAFFERLGRGEAIDHSLLRAWFVHRLRHPSQREMRETTPVGRALLARLAEALEGRDDERVPDSGADLIDRVRARLTPQDRGPSAAIVRDPTFARFYRSAALHGAHLRPGQERPTIPAAVVDLATAWQDSDFVPALLRYLEMRAWPVLGSGDVLALMCVGRGAPDDPGDREGACALSVLTRWSLSHRDRLPRQGTLRLRLLASAETMDRARMLAALVEPSVDVAVIGPLDTRPDAVEGIRTDILTALKSDPSQPHNTDELHLVLNPGKPVMGNAMIAAGVQWSLEAACTLRAVELGRDAHLQPVVADGGRVLCRLGPDARLARLASAAVRRLDTRTAWQLLGLASPSLSPARDAAARLHRDLYAPADPGADRRATARRRLMLVAHALADEPLPACYTAIECLRPGLFNWSEWAELCRGNSELRELNRLRNGTPYAHRPGKGPQRPKSAAHVHSLIVQAAEGFAPGTPALELAARHDRLLAMLTGVLPISVGVMTQGESRRDNGGQPGW